MNLPKKTFPIHPSTRVVSGWLNTRKACATPRPAQSTGCVANLVLWHKLTVTCICDVGGHLTSAARTGCSATRPEAAATR